MVFSARASMVGGGHQGGTLGGERSRGVVPGRAYPRPGPVEEMEDTEGLGHGRGVQSHWDISGFFGWGCCTVPSRERAVATLIRRRHRFAEEEGPRGSPLHAPGLHRRN